MTFIAESLAKEAGGSNLYPHSPLKSDSFQSLAQNHWLQTSFKYFVYLEQHFKSLKKAMSSEELSSKLVIQTSWVLCLPAPEWLDSKGK